MRICVWYIGAAVNNYTKSPTTPNPTKSGVITPRPTFGDVPDPTMAPVPTTDSPTRAPNDNGGGNTPEPTPLEAYEGSTPSPTDSTNQLNINYITVIVMIALCLSVLII